MIHQNLFWDLPERGAFGLHMSNRVRILLALVAKSSVFSNVVLITILANCCTLAIDSQVRAAGLRARQFAQGMRLCPTPTLVFNAQNETTQEPGFRQTQMGIALDVLDYAFTGVFILEMIVKVRGQCAPQEFPRSRDSRPGIRGDPA